MKSTEIRNQFLEFFASKGHLIVSSAPIVIKDDPTLLFTNSGMNQFKDNFLGLKPPAAPRIADTQKCLRASGKHNDLEDVGHDTYHNTMFEMLGNWSFGDYYKKDAIAWAWELMTKVFGLPEDRLYATVFGGDEADGLGKDEDAVTEWKKWIPADRILACGKKDNFWEMGDVGPCGPCSEIHIDLRTEEERALVPGHELVNADNPHVIELWNLVFMEFNRSADKSLSPLPAKNVDTGMGFERICMVLQGKKSNYDSDLFDDLKAHLERISGIKYGQAEESDIAMRVVMDHIRAVSFAISDGQLPSNGGAGYVIRAILRRATRYAYRFLGQDKPFLYNMVAILVELYKDIFPELGKQEKLVRENIEAEEKSFLRTLARGTQLFEQYIENAEGTSKVLDGEFAFKLKDTFGFPFELTQLMAKELGWTVDQEVFHKLLKAQSERAQLDAQVQTGDWVKVNEFTQMPVFVGYDELETSARILQYRTVKGAKGNVYQVVTDVTPFYAEGGGQVGDTGTISKGDEVIHVLDTRRENELIVHFVNKLPQSPDGEWIMEVNKGRRKAILANHSATHLLHAALRRVLGTHVEQRGSLVSDKILRFDFSHFNKMSPEEMEEVEKIVNEKIAASIPRGENRSISIAEAKAKGAMALFGEKYGDTVRMITFDPAYSVELCGGCHVENTSDIRLFKFVSESSIAAGVRRVEAVTSGNAIEYLDQKAAVLERINELLKGAQDPVRAVEDLVQKSRQMEKEIEKMNAEKVSRMQGDLKTRVKSMGDFDLLNEVVEVGTAENLKTLAFNLRQGLSNTLVVLGAVIDEKPLLNVILTEDLEKAGRFNASQLIRDLAKEIQGGGGGQPFFASAGGKNAAGIPAAVKKAEELAK
ncbi:MAG: alanine--tRNA ligase [Bacteroidia bacterium]|nr:alanine--tRNA ligase [Bacteroidia bacterium]